MNREDRIQEVVENIVRCQRPANLSDWPKIDLSQAQVSMLFMLSYHKQLQVKQISEYLGVSKSAVSQMVDALIKKQLVDRQLDKKDRRIAHLSLAVKGKESLKKIHKAKFAGFRSRLETLTTPELEQLAVISGKMRTVRIENK